MQNLLFFLRSLASGQPHHKDAAQRIWRDILLPSQIGYTNGSRRTGGVLHATLFKEGTTPCDTIAVQFGQVHPKNPYFAAEKIWRLWEYTSDEFASQSADTELDDYSQVVWTDLRRIKFGGALKIRALGSNDLLILSFSGLHQHVDEAVVHQIATVYEDMDNLLISPYSNNAALKTTAELFAMNLNCFFRAP